ncbi:GTP pyrophosphokinase [Paenibacillus ehimensis]|uniref:RelA/SpoT domain-containing protein n=1 Tax=Paenibacillus ehimensis TaxID=79264 RepID=A0ABT8VGS3_9BACL|nr:hypothetical protein [Paenibacillus ehimensis]MDO3680172.1 hypothetical protein [Paenibacillus ehimensis]
MLKKNQKNLDEIMNWYVKQRPIYRNLAHKVESIIREVLDSAKVSYYTISSRAKEIESFISKASKDKYTDPVKEIKDLAGIRIITFVKSEVYECSDIIKPLFDIDSEHSMDKSKELGDDKVGYRSVHYVAKLTEERLKLPEYRIFQDMQFEIQIRTILEHAWADISHDRNYKFNGVLPPENDIQRRFSLAAATLELVDREFDSIAREISEYEKYVEQMTMRSELDIDINTTSLGNFLFHKFRDFIRDDQLAPGFNQNDETIIAELKGFGIKTLSDLNNLIDDDKLESYIYLSSNYLGLLRHIMIFSDAEKYFKKAWGRNWHGMELDYFEYVKGFNKDIEGILKKYKVEVWDARGIEILLDDKEEEEDIA